MTARRNTILVLEDDREIRESIVDVLEAEGYLVESAANGKEGLARLREIEKPCLILLDLMMPVMSGGEFLALARKDDALATIPVVIVSAWPSEAAQIAGATQGYVKKPIDLETLLATVDRFCSKGGDGEPGSQTRSGGASR
jgi:CheY-like chemotaxis protein